MGIMFECPCAFYHIAYGLKSLSMFSSTFTLSNHLFCALSSLMIGFMGTTAFLSMWISNTASTAMMLPIANAVLQQLSDTEASAEEREYDLTAAKDGQENQAFEISELKAKDSSINMGVCVCVCVSLCFWPLLNSLLLRRLFGCGFFLFVCLKFSNGILQMQIRMVTPKTLRKSKKTMLFQVGFLTLPFK